MKKKSIKNLSLKKSAVSNLKTHLGGECSTSFYDMTWRSFLYNNCPVGEEPLPMTAEAYLCPDNSLYGGCSLGYCPDSWWC